MIEQEVDHPAPRRTKPRGLPAKIPAGGFVLPLDVIKAIGGGDIVLGEELIAHIFPQMLDASHARALPPHVVSDIGEGSIAAGRKVLAKFIELMRQRGKAEQSRGSAVHHDALDRLDLDPAVFSQAHQIGERLGSNPGGTFTSFPDGIDRYVKAPRNEDQARQEVLANRLYQAVDVPVAHAELTRLPDGKLAVASHIVPDARPLKNERPAAIPHLLEHLPADAWLANWDVVGGRKDNILLDGNHSAWRIDQGGSLNYRPKGRLKGREFGNTVGETTSLLNPKYRSGEVFAGVEPDPNNATAQRIASLPDHTIRSLVHHYIGEHDAYGVRGLADKLIARRHDLARQYGLYA